jgi:4-hydroxy-tetrahydrodipicolinate reductase
LDESIAADVALVSTTSSLRALAEQVDPLIAAGIHVVSTCEELVFPWLHGNDAEKVDAAARQAGVVVVGTGVNPGFVMDVLPVLVSSSCLDFNGVRVRRTVDLSRRRSQLSSKLGVGLGEADWLRRAEELAFGHKGLVESGLACAVGCAWLPEKWTFGRNPVLDGAVVVGIREEVRVECAGSRSVELELEFCARGADLDTVEILGPDPVKVEIAGLRGDEATVARLVHAASVIECLSPGLRMPLELPSWTGSDPAGVLETAALAQKRGQA